jgi:outer membrane protein
MRRSIRVALLLLGVAAAPAAGQSVPSTAGMPSPEEISSRDSFTLALGVGMVPDYEGSDDYRLIPAGGARGKYHGISFYSRGLYLFADVVPSSGDKVKFNAGPVIGIRLNRTRKVKDDFVDLLPERKMALEVGGFAGVSFKGLTNPYDSLSLQVDAVHDIGKAHKSTAVRPNLTFSTPLSRQTYVSTGIGMEFVSNRYADYYYGISPAQGLVSGLAPFNGDGGMKDWNANFLVNQSLTGDLLSGLGIFGLANYSRLVGDFKKSPIVDDRGSASQWLVAGGLSYSW